MPEASDSLELIRGVSDICARIDERTASIQRGQAELVRRVDTLFEQHATLNSRIVVLESKNDISIRGDVAALASRMSDLDQKVGILTFRQTGTDSKWSTIVSTITSVFTAVVGAFLIWKLGIKP